MTTLTTTSADGIPTDRVRDAGLGPAARPGVGGARRALVAVHAADAHGAREELHRVRLRSARARRERRRKPYAVAREVEDSRGRDRGDLVATRTCGRRRRAPRSPSRRRRAAFRCASSRRTSRPTWSATRRTRPSPTTRREVAALIAAISSRRRGEVLHAHRGRAGLDALRDAPDAVLEGRARGRAHAAVRRGGDGPALRIARGAPPADRGAHDRARGRQDDTDARRTRPRRSRAWCRARSTGSCRARTTASDRPRCGPCWSTCSVDPPVLPRALSAACRRCAELFEENVGLAASRQRDSRREDWEPGLGLRDGHREDDLHQEGLPRARREARRHLGPGPRLRERDVADLALAWANTQSGIPAPLLRACESLRARGDRDGIPELTAPQLPLDAWDGHLIAMIASALTRECAGYYRGPYDGGAIFVLLTGPSSSRRSRCPRCASRRSIPRS